MAEPGAGALQALAADRVDWRFKGLPPDAEGRTVGELAAEKRSLFTGGFTTPLLTLSEESVEHNLALLEDWSARHGLAFAPHGKTSMAPQLFSRQLARGAWGITAAVPSQVRVYRAFGVPRIFLANELVDPAALAWVAAELDADPGFTFITYADSVRGVALMDEALRAAGARRRLDVVVELGCDEGRTGVRDEATADEVADAVARTDTLRLVGVAGYEGELKEKTPRAVTAWLERLVLLGRRFDGAGRFAGTGEIVLSAGGSAWFDAVGEVFKPVTGFSKPLLKLLRSGAYVAHDDGHYRRVTPFNRLPGDEALHPAFRLWAQVVSRPEPGLALLNAGKRDASFDLDLPEAQTVRQADGTVRPARGLRVTALADQHTFLHVAEGARLEVGDWVGFGLSHPCTVFDKWQLIPLVAADGTVTDYIRTYF
jgi:D-serine deaminase-like pyridoxal phosphate-dependent protein